MSGMSELVVAVADGVNGVFERGAGVRSGRQRWKQRGKKAWSGEIEGSERASCECLRRRRPCLLLSTASIAIPSSLRYDDAYVSTFTIMRFRLLLSCLLGPYERVF